jgi:hypothetical protein
MLVQSVPTLTVTRIVTVIKSITAKAVFKEYPELKKSHVGFEPMDKRVLCKYSWDVC